MGEKLIIELDGAPQPTGRQAMVNIISTTPAGICLCNTLIIMDSGHPSFKRRGNFRNLRISNSTLRLTVMGLGD